MKKLFWCGVGVAVAAASCVYLASRHVEYTPFPTVAQALVDLGGEETSASGAGGESGTIPGLDAPTPVEPQGEAAPMEVVAVDKGQPGHIILEDVPAPPTSEFGTSFSLTELPAPPMMPYCHEDAIQAEARMPYADEANADAGEEESEPRGDIWNILRRVAAEANAAAAAEQLPVMPRETNDEEKNDEETSEQPCPEDHDYHKTHMTCPYTGRSYPLQMVAPSAPETPKENSNSNQNNNGNNKPQYHESRKPIGEEEESSEVVPYHRLDTMEFRPSDAGFEHFVPGPF